MSPWKCRAEESGENSHSEFPPFPPRLDPDGVGTHISTATAAVLSLHGTAS